VSRRTDIADMPHVLGAIRVILAAWQIRTASAGTA
jgi:hypothetical protein